MSKLDTRVKTAKIRREVLQKVHRLVSKERRASYEESKAKQSELLKAFKYYDKDRSGYLDMAELIQLMTDLDDTTPSGTPPTSEEVSYIVKVADASQNGRLEVSEIEIAIREWRTYIRERDQLESKLRMFDRNRNGQLNREELGKYLQSLNGGLQVSKEEVDWVLEEADIIADGQISKIELLLATSAWYGALEEQSRHNSRMCVIQ